MLLQQSLGVGSCVATRRTCPTEGSLRMRLRLRLRLRASARVRVRVCAGAGAGPAMWSLHLGMAGPAMWGYDTDISAGIRI